MRAVAAFLVVKAPSDPLVLCVSLAGLLLIFASVQITMAERFGVEGRGGFYDQSDATRDVVQSHLFQVVGFLAMEPPAATSNESIRPLGPEDVVRGQFLGYRKEADVARDSNFETFTAARLHVDSPRWGGVPFFIRADKCLPATMTEVLVMFKPPTLSELCGGQANYVRFQLSLDVTNAIGARVKRPGDELIGDPAELKMVDRTHAEEMATYERLLGDAMAGDGALFPGQDGVEAAWKIAEPILDLATPAHEYEPGTWARPKPRSPRRVSVAATARSICYPTAKTESQDDETNNAICYLRRQKSPDNGASRGETSFSNTLLAWMPTAKKSNKHKHQEMRFL